MADKTNQSDPKADKAERLAEALRQNLHRRKAQARQRQEAEQPDGQDPDAG